MSDPLVGAPAAPLPVPAWLAQLAERVQTSPPSAFRRFEPPPGGARRCSAVLILIGPDSTSALDASPPDAMSDIVVLTQRAATMRQHAGQVSFPGGGREPGDLDESATALREAAEEIGLDASEVSVLTKLPALHIAVSGYDVTPVLAWWHRPGRIYSRQPAEVEHVLRVPIANLINPTARFRARHPSGYTGPAFGVGGITVWGFTAGVLDRLLDLAGLTKEWDPGQVREIS